LTYCKHRIIGVSVIEKEAHDQPTQAYFFLDFGYQRRRKKGTRLVKKGLLTKRMGNISIDFFLPNPFGNWGSKGVIYFSPVKLLPESKESTGVAHERPSNV